MVLGFPEKVVFYQKDRFPKIRYNNLQYFDLVHVPKPKFGLFLRLPVLNIFFLPSLPFSRPFCFRYLLRCIFFLAAVKRWVLIALITVNFGHLHYNKI